VDAREKLIFFGQITAFVVAVLLLTLALSPEEIFGWVLAFALCAF
jgi:hypothetical protein